SAPLPRPDGLPGRGPPAASARVAPRHLPSPPVPAPGPSDPAVAPAPAPVAPPVTTPVPEPDDDETMHAETPGGTTPAPRRGGPAAWQIAAASTLAPGYALGDQEHRPLAPVSL